MYLSWPGQEVRRWAVAGYGGLLFVVSTNSLAIGRPIHLTTYLASEDHHGLGLSVVRTIADAHGWTHRLAESDAGGVRVEFTDVE